MRRQIQVLPDVLVDQIAAGEVVERPASVVKELVENALDAGATHITVEIEGGGMRRIRVLDNGEGMSAAQAELALQRHATSKLRALDDLFALHSFGFRGEALPSIASVSRLTLTTRTRESDQPAASLGAFRMHVEGGHIVSRSEVGAPVGTCVEVADLLFNVPARQKFLKGEATETSHITDAVSKLALANPAVHFRLKSRSRTTINAPAHENYEERVKSVMGARLGAGAQMAKGEYGGVSVQAFLASPEVAQSTTRGLQLFVGRRPIRDRGILHAVLQGYQDLIPRGRYPVAVILVETPKADVDVNVHPQKLEVRFSDPQLVYAAVRQVVRTGASEAQWTPLAAFSPGHRSQLTVTASNSPPYRSERLQARQSFAGQGALGSTPASALAVSYAREHARMMLPWARPAAPTPADATRRPMSTPGPMRAEGSGPIADLAVDKEAMPPSLGSAQPEPRTKNFFGSLRYLGQLDRTYLLCESEGELVMLDQHSAHERVELEKLLCRFRERRMPVQRLLFPQTIELSAPQAAAADAHGDQLSGMGFELDDFGESAGRQSYALKAVPAGLRTSEPEEVLLTLLSELARTGSERAVDDKIESMLATVACHSVVRAGDSLSGREVESLLHAMDGVDFRGAAPHNRPVLLRIGLDEIARRFGRS